MNFKITNLSEQMGISIENFDCSKKLTKNELESLKNLIQDNHFICFKNQLINEENLLNFTRNFGNLESYPEKDKTKNKIEIFNVANVSATGDHLHEDDPRVVLQKNNSRWHTDSSYRYYPALFSVLYGKEVLPKNAKGGQTEFSNMLLAYESLSKEKKQFLKPLQQVHSYNDIRRLEPSLPELSFEEKSNFPPVTHPIIRIHTDRKFKK